MLRPARVAAAILGLGPLAITAMLAGAGCQRGAQLRPDGCPEAQPVDGERCNTDPARSCSADPSGNSSYACNCNATRDGHRVWSCVSAGGPLAPPDLPA